jgi:putative RecB family exonuclease
MAQLTHLSHSSVQSYAKCGYRFKLEKLDGHRSEPSWAMVAGSAIHAATENLDLKDFGVVTGGPLTFAEALEVELAEQKERWGWEEKDVRSTGRKSKEWPAARDRKYWEATGQLHVDRWRNFMMTSGFSVAVIDDAPAVEIEFLVEIAPGVSLKGFIDRVLDHPQYGLGCVDLKSGDRDPDSNIQLLDYGLALRMTTNEDVVIRWGAYYATKEGGGLSAPVDLLGTPDDEIKEPIISTWAGVQAGVFVPNLSRDCGWCGVREHCKFYNGML